ncbi:MAG: nucleoside triphosphate pyrophosphohydrolase [Rhizobiaceae bacterium]|nr:nucleoside triphosphate pyrophosphohydrolase [Rhizobiaceae bacterium]
MKPSENISRLIEIMAALRTPGTGCAWDLEQDFQSIVPYTIEEAYEVADAIERDDMEDLRLELGDLLLQSVYHARLAEEAGHFGFDDVVRGITEKMIRRHPHVFGDANGSAKEYSAAGMAKGTWERIKAEEKAEYAAKRLAMGLPEKSGQESLLDDVPGTLPGLAQAVKLQNKAAKVGFDWNDPRAVIDKVREEIVEVEEVLDEAMPDTEHLEEEIGDVLFAIANLARHLDIDPDKALRRANSKFRKRFRYIEDNIENAGHTMDSANLDAMEHLWNESKKNL